MQVAKCAAIKADGTRCRNNARSPSEYCYSHDPSEAERRHRYAAMGGRVAGRGRPLVELADLKAENTELRRKLHDGELKPHEAAVLVQSINAHARLIETAIKVHEYETLAGELDQMREVLGTIKGRRSSYGA